MTRGTDDDVPPTERGEDVASSAPTEDADADRGDPLLRQIAGMAPRAPLLDLAAGTLVDATYRIERRLGAGGMGIVYLARDIKLERDVAIKVHAGAADERLAREAKAIARLVDPNVVTVHEIGVFEGHPFVAMEYLDGGTARTWLAAAPRTPDEILAFFLAAARGLAAAHRASLIHRDFKPDNVLVGRDGRIRVADFGLAGSDAGAGGPGAIASRMTVTGAVMGTPAYMAPEQHDPSRAAITAAADQFAFCVTLWEALFGERPFRGADLAELQRSFAAGPTPPRGHRVAARIVDALRRGLAVDPAHRWPSMTALADALRPSPPRRLAPIAIVLGTAIIASGVVVVAMRSSRDEPRSIDASISAVTIVADAAPPIDELPIDAALDAAIAAIDAAPPVDARPRVTTPERPESPRACTTNEECKRSENCVAKVCTLRQECEPEFVASIEREADDRMKAIMYSHARDLYTLVLRCKPSLVTKALRAACKARDRSSADALWSQVPRARRASLAKECAADGIELH